MGPIREKNYKFLNKFYPIENFINNEGNSIYLEFLQIIELIIEEDFKIDFVEFINQNPIGKSSRSNPVTYVKASDEIRSLFSSHTYD